MTAALRGLWRALCVLACVWRGAFTLWRHQGRWTNEQRAWAVQHWAQAMLRAMGVQCRVQGQAHDGPVMWVANHIAWLDILVLHSMGYARFVAKSEVHGWPLIGPMAAAAGTLFIERATRKDALRVVHQIATAFEQGDRVAFFPEGTTSQGDTVLPFHANLLQAAVVTSTPVQPVLIRYFNAQGERATHVRYIDDDSLLASVWRVLSAPQTLVQVRWALAQQPQGRHRRIWGEELRQTLLALWQ